MQVKYGRVRVVCPDCGGKRTVSVNINSTGRCRSCASKRIGKGPRPGRKTGQDVSCLQCGVEFYRRRCEPTKRFCSATCGNTSRRRKPRVTRACLVCSAGFTVVLNAAISNHGRYCSVACRIESTRRPHRPGKRAGWRTARKHFFNANNDFCCRCGRRDGRLAVHHIEPYRVGGPHKRYNLVTLCIRCHPVEERISDRIATLPPDLRQAAALIVKANMMDLWHIHQGRRLAS